MEYKNMKMPELKSLARGRGLRNYSWMRKAELVALLQMFCTIFLKQCERKANVDHFQFMKGPSHQRTEEEMQFVFDSLGWNYSLLSKVKGPPVPAPALASISNVSLSPSTCNL